MTDAPFALLAELTHRCPLKCPYCFNPTELLRKSQEMDTASWRKVISEAAGLGILQVHFSGGEPTARDDLEELVAHADAKGLYTNLITSGVLLTRDRLETLKNRGLMHVQLGIQDADEAKGDIIAGYRGAQAKKTALSHHITEIGLALTVNAVIHRHNIHNIDAIIDLALEMGASRLEVASTQYYGWGLINRAALIPTQAQLDQLTETVTRRMQELTGILTFDYVTPDYYGRRPKACMNGWGRQFMHVTPDGYALPCHAAQTIPDLSFEHVKDRTLADIWEHSAAFNAYRGTAWMKEPCQSCEHKERDWGGCRCQALALTGAADNADPVCELSEHHWALAVLTRKDAQTDAEFVYRTPAKPA